VVDLALPELVEGDAVVLVEWGDVAAPALGADALTVTLRYGGSPSPDEQDTDEEIRLIEVGASGPYWAARRDEVARRLAMFGVPAGTQGQVESTGAGT
jgi:tRNA A37 threonylcarbamoyladenosine biosynthesis protein TsaE